MFVSIDETEDKKYENEKRNIVAFQHYNNRLKWQQSILEEDNAQNFVTELTQTLLYVNCFITKIEVESAVLNRQCDDESFSTKDKEKKFKGYLAMGRELITKLKVLVTLEKSSAMEKFEQSHVRKLSYAATEDTTSGVDTESVVDGRGIFSREASFERRNSQTITLAHKYAASFTRHYEIFNKLNHDVEEVVERFNLIVDFIHQQLQMKISGIVIAEDKGMMMEEIISPFETISTRPSFDSVDSDRDTQSEFTPNTKLATDILEEHLQRSTLHAVYKHIRTSGTGHLIEHTYSCNVANLYSEGKSRKKSKAKEEAATRMLRQLIERHNYNRLPLEIVSFSENQISQISFFLDEREDFGDQLKKTCLQMHEPPPLYTVLSEIGKNNDPYFKIKCEAMGYTAVGWYLFPSAQLKKIFFAHIPWCCRTKN